MATSGQAPIACAPETGNASPASRSPAEGVGDYFAKLIATATIGLAQFGMEDT